MNKYLLTVTAAALSLTVNAQQGVITAKDYERAESFMAYNTAQYVDRGRH